MDRLSDLMPRVLARKGLKDQATAALIIHKATLWISEHLSDVSSGISVSRLKDGLLYIESEQGTAAQELTQKKEYLRAYLNGLQAQSVHDIIIQQTRNDAN